MNRAILQLETRLCVGVGAIFAALAVGLGAFGAHSLRQAVTPARLEVWGTATDYQLGHALGLILVGLVLHIRPRRTALRFAAWSLALGTVVFSGSLYALVLANQPWLGAITPIGGVALILGWIAFAVGALTGETTENAPAPGDEDGSTGG